MGEIDELRLRLNAAIDKSGGDRSGATMFGFSGFELR
jgi:hypothetical protein